MRPTILLFDIDGTLITTGGVGRRAIERAFRELHGESEACTSFRFDGMTDRLIARTGLTILGVEPTEAAIDALLTAYVRLLEDEVERADAAKYRVHDGIAEALATARHLGMGVGLGTGNVVEGARIKLSRVGIFEKFAFGGFGSDAEDRAALILRGAERGAEHLKVPLAECRVVVIGDTPKDIDAAVSIGAESIGVGTGGFSTRELAEHGATHAFDSLAAPGALDVMLGR
ncbi:MAG TPA: HAD family hydrolase [Polyangiaceae bacterium]|nr:HAD family hydrolase [Polyangiaceae bacterium]